MKHIVLGTSGHIDHGKTALIKALTGYDADTLEEEKKRGITINNGYTSLNFGEDLTVGIIDVPGHEKFIKNMVAGATSIDLVLFVIGADDGIMPQTREHFSILKTLGVKKGIIVLTKSDLVDRDWIDFIGDEIKEFVKGSFLENASIIPVSSKTGEGIEELKEEIRNVALKAEDKDKEALFRMAIDRVFSVTGFGNVVTGTILGGKVKVGDVLELYPSNDKCKVRGLQVHGSERTFAEAGERCAINLTSIEKDRLYRGLILGEEDKEVKSFIVDCIIEVSKDREKPLKNRDRVRIHHGTREIIGRVVLLDREELNKGEKGYAQLRLEEELSSRSGDRIVIRNYSPLETIGGGIILESMAKKAKRFKDEYIEDLKVKEEGSVSDKIEWIIRDFNGIVTINDIKKTINREDEELEDSLEKLLSDKKIIKIDEGYFHNRYLTEKCEMIKKELEEFYKNNPLKIGMKKEEVKSKVFDKKFKKAIFDELLKLMEERELISLVNNRVSDYNHKVKLNLAQKNMKNMIIDVYKKAEFKTPKIKELMQNEKDKKTFKEIFEYLVELGEIIEMPEEVVYYKDYVEKAKEIVKGLFKEKDVLELGDLKEALPVSRKYLVAILEYFDNIEMTKRVDSGGRVLID